jgi:hypothetical protein
MKVGIQKSDLLEMESELTKKTLEMIAKKGYATTMKTERIICGDTYVLKAKPNSRLSYKLFSTSWIKNGKIVSKSSII